MLARPCRIQFASQRMRVVRLFVVVVVLLQLDGLVATAFGQSLPIRLSAPGPKARNSSGLTIEVVRYLCPYPGNAPLRITIASTNGRPVPRPRSLVVQVEYQNPGDSLAYFRQPVKFDEGASQASAVVLVPQGKQLSGRMEIRVFDDNDELTDLRTMADPFAGQGELFDMTTPWIGVSEQISIHDPLDPIDPDEVAIRREMAGIQRSIDTGVSTFQRGDINSMMFIHPNELFERWEAYSAIDVILISDSDLRQLQATAPEKIVALKRWWRTGRMLLVMCDDFDSADSNFFNELLNQSGSPSMGVEWITDYGGYLQSLADESAQYEISAARIDRMNEIESDDFKIRFGVSGQSSILVFDRRSVDPLSAFVMSELTSIEFRKTRNENRRGYATFQSDLAYNDLLIPGVGLPPVTSFRVMITLFVILIGPVNYVLLRYMRRLHYVLLTVPLGALFVCLGLLSYAALGDGLTIRSRMLSHTLIDQKNGEYVSLSRQSYYSPFMPSEGYRFPDDCEVLPVVGDSTRRRIYQWERREGWQYVTSGNTGARATAQYLVSRAGKINARIDIDAPSEDANSLTAVNELGVDIELLGIVDKDGRIFIARDIADGDTFRCTFVPQAEFFPEFSRMVRESTPDFPDGLNADYFRTSWDQVASKERGYDKAGVLGSLIRRAYDSDNLQPMSYWALTNSSPAIVPAAPNAKEQSSLHILEGRW